MNAARSVRPLTAAANVNKNAAVCKREKTRQACIFVNASAFARRCWRPAIHAASASPCRHSRPHPTWQNVRIGRRGGGISILFTIILSLVRFKIVFLHFELL